MTLEEKAYEYAHESMAWCEDFDFTYEIAENKIKQAYIAGAKENGTVWHKVADGDLPKENDELVLCYCSVGYKLLSASEFKLFMPVYAWTEIPRYEGEKE